MEPREATTLCLCLTNPEAWSFLGTGAETYGSVFKRD